MSAEAVAWALRQRPDGGATAKWALVVLADYADRLGVVRAPLDTVAVSAMLARSTLASHILALKRLDLIQNLDNDILRLRLEGGVSFTTFATAPDGASLDPEGRLTDSVLAGHSFSSSVRDTEGARGKGVRGKGGRGSSGSGPRPEDALWAVMLEEGMVTERHELNALRRGKLRQLHREHLRRADDPVSMFREVCVAVKTRPWWSERPSTWAPDKAFNNPSNREEHVLWALGRHPDQTKGALTEKAQRTRVQKAEAEKRREAEGEAEAMRSWESEVDAWLKLHPARLRHHREAAAQRPEIRALARTPAVQERAVTAAVRDAAAKEAGLTKPGGGA